MTRQRLDGAVGLLCALSATLATSGVLAHYGLTIGEQVRFAMAFVGTVLVPGAALNRCFRGKLIRDGGGSFSRFAAAGVLGLGPQLLGWLVAVDTDRYWPLWAVPLLCAVLARAGAWRLEMRGPAATSTGRKQQERAHGLRRRAGAASTPWWASVGLLAVWVLLLRSLVAGVWSSTPVTGQGPWYEDMYWHVAITADALHHAPPTDPQSAADGMLSYHWFSNAQAAALTLSSGIDLDKICVLAWFVPIAAAALGAVYGLGVMLSRSPAVGLVAAALFAVSPSFLPLGQFDGGATDSLYWLSPSHILAVPVGVVAVRVLVVVLRDSLRGFPARVDVALAAYLLVLCPGVKVSLLPVLLAGLVVALVMARRLRRHPLHPDGGRPVSRPVLVLVGLGGVVLVGTMGLFGGGGGGSHLSYGSAVGQLSMWSEGGGSGYADTLLMNATMLVVLGTYLPYLVVLVFRGVKDPAVWFFAGTFGSALVVMFTLDHPSRSELYFMRGMVPVGAAFLAWGVRQAVREHLRCGGIAWLGALVVGTWWSTTGIFRSVHKIEAAWVVPLALGTVALVVALVRAVKDPISRRSARAAVLVGTVVGFSLSTSVEPILADPLPRLSNDYGHATPALTSSELSGAEALARANPHGELVATNVHCLTITTRPNCDARGFWVAAFTRSPVLVGGWGYAASARALQGRGGRSYLTQSYPFAEIERVNELFFTHPDVERARQLRRLGVRFVYADARASWFSPRLGEVARTIWSSPTVQVDELAGGTR